MKPPHAALAAFASLAALLSALAGPALAAEPFVTVSPARGGNAAWWLAPMASRPTGTSVAGVPLARINAALDETESPWCAADALDEHAFTSDDPAIRAEIAADFASAGELFRATMRVRQRTLDAVVGNFRACSGEIAPFVLLLDRRRPEPRVVFVRMFTDWGPFITLRRAGQDLAFSSCLQCDHAEILAYDRGARRFYWRSEEP